VYQQSISRRDPGCIVFLLDRSDSMRAPWAGTGLTLAQGAAQAINEILFALGVQSTKEFGAAMRRYFYVGAVGYGLQVSDGGEGVESAWGGPMAGRGIVPLPELIDNPVAIRDHSTVDRSAARLPEWILPANGYRTPMCQAIAMAGAQIYDWVQEFRSSFPPIVINITDGLVTDSPYQGAGLQEWANRLTGISTGDGRVLLLNVFLSPVRAPAVWFPVGAGNLPPPGPDLFGITSVLPAPLIANARGSGVTVADGARGLVFNADLAMLGQFLEIGTRVAIVDQ
jgi:hypothetical protein